MADRIDAERLASASEAILGTVENGPHLLISNALVRDVVGRYVADACHSIAVAAGLDEAAAVCAALRGNGPFPTDPFADARDRLARSLFAAAVGPRWAPTMVAAWDRGEIKPEDAAPYLAQADASIAIITGEG